MKKQIIGFLRRMNNQHGIGGILVVMMISFAVFTILSTAHIYTIRHSKYQKQIREASIMQVETENFAMLIRSAYEDGKTSSTNVCNLGGIDFADLFKGGGCSKTSGKPEDYRRCLISSHGRGYCIVNIKAPTGTPKAPPSAPTSTSASQPQIKQLKTACYQGGHTGTSCKSNASQDPTCKAKCAEHKSGSLTSTIYDECCVSASLRVINCNDSKPTDCSSYEGSSDAKKVMFCEICEMSHNSNKQYVFTYTICPTDTTNFSSSTKDDALYKCVTTAGTRESQAFSQTFRILAD